MQFGFVFGLIETLKYFSSNMQIINLILSMECAQTNNGIFCGRNLTNQTQINAIFKGITLRVINIDFNFQVDYLHVIVTSTDHLNHRIYIITLLFLSQHNVVQQEGETSQATRQKWKTPLKILSTYMFYFLKISRGQF